VPYEVAGDAFAVVQVTNNGVMSNAVTLYNDFSAPGVFTLDGSGTGEAAALHPDGSIVNAQNPAQVGETIAVFVTGLGSVTPGAMAETEDVLDVLVDDIPATVTFSGLAPGFAGLYQLNFVVPSAPDGGPLGLDIEDTVTAAYNSIATLAVAAPSSASAPRALRSGQRSRAIKHAAQSCYKFATSCTPARR